MNKEQGKNTEDASPDEKGTHQPMMTRGAARPQMKMGDSGKKDDSPNDKKKNSGGEMGEMGEMSEDERLKMLKKHHQQTLWVPFAVIILAVWLMSAPFTNGYSDAPMAWSDLLSGAAIIVLTLLWIKRPRMFWARWVLSLIGFWLLLAPLVFWAKVSAAYQINTLIGILLIALTILIPGMPAMIMMMKMGPDVPPGWTYNPSSWLQRAPMIFLAFFGFFLSTYLASYQLGYIHWIFDPFFSGRNGLNGTATVLTSDVSKSFPISDGGFGAVSYSLEALMGFMGGTARWRTMPWMVLFFGILVVPLGATSIILVMLQPISVGAWCAICLVTAAAMLIMIPLSLDEVWAMAQFMLQKHREGKPFWRTFFKGDTVEDEKPQDKERRENPEFTAGLSKTAPAMVWGMSLPWNLVLSTIVGIWLMASPDVFGTTGHAADSSHLVGALIVVWSVIVTAEVARAGRFLNLLFGVWIVIAPFVLMGAGTTATVNSIICGLLVAAFCFPRGAIREGYGNWNPYIF